jgi:hypothetical protein
MAQDEDYHVDPEDSTEISSTSLVQRKPKLTRTRRVIPESFSERQEPCYNCDECDSGNPESCTKPIKVLTHKPEQVANSLTHLHDDIARSHKSTINCEFSAPGSAGHTGKATHFVRLPGQPREGTWAVCTGHAKEVSAAASRKGEHDQLDIKPINIRHVRSWKILQAQNREEVRTYLEAALRSQGMRGEDELFAPKGPGGRKPHVAPPSGGTFVNPSGSGAPLMSEEEAADYNSAREKDKIATGKKPPEYNLSKQPRGVYIGNKASKSRVDDPSEGKKKHRGGFTKPEDIEGDSSVAITISGWKPRPSRLDRALETVGEEHAERAIIAFNQSRQARKQQAIQQRKNQEFGLGSGTRRELED